MKVVIDAGHGGTDPGAIGNGLKEKDITRQIADKVERLLDMYEVEVIQTRKKDENRTLAERCHIANVSNADLFVSIHINAGGGTGYETYLHTSMKNKNTTIALKKAFHKQTLFKDRGLKFANFQVLRGTQMTAILTENGFIDNTSDVFNIKNYIDTIAEYHMWGIVEFLKLKRKPQAKKKRYYIESGGFNEYKTANDMLQLFKDKGYYAVIKERME